MKNNVSVFSSCVPGSAFFLRKATHDPRAAALSALSRVLAGEADAQEALDAVLQSPAMMPSDKGLCTELFYGHLRMYLRLQWFSSRFLKKPEKLPWEMRLCLDQALYSLAGLRMPARAAVHWAVEHVRHRFGQRLGAVANGALRSMQRELASFRDVAFYRAAFPDALEAEACWHSMPLWIVRLWHEAYGPQKAGQLLELAGSSPPQGLRLNRSCSGWEKLRVSLLENREGDGDGRKAQAVGACALWYAHSLPYEARRLVSEGRASRQSVASYAALEAFEPRSWPVPVWDCCAGRGGKTMVLLEQGISVALVSDTSARRLKALPLEYSRLGLSQPSCPPILMGSAAEAGKGEDAFRPLDPEAQALSLPERFGAILVDAPCSGLGTLSRHPEIRLRRSPEDIAQLAQLQAGILDALWPRLESGGSLIYLTCTASPAENEEQVAAFLERHPDAACAQEYQGGEWELLGEYFYGAMLRKDAGS